MARGPWSFTTSSPRTCEYMEYLSRVLNSRDASVEEVLARKLSEARSRAPRVARTFKVRGEVFQVRAYLLGSDVSLASPAGLHMPLRVAANPAIMIEGKYAVLYVRVSTLGGHPIPDPGSRTFICVGRVPLDGLRGRLRLDAKPVTYPLVYVERVEDPRTYVGGSGKELYHVRAVMPWRPIAGADSFILTFASNLREGELIPESMEPVRFVNPAKGEEAIIRDCRDTFPLNDSLMVIRPIPDSLGYGAPLIAPRKGPVVNPAEARAYPELMPGKHERKTGGNCSVRVSSNEHLLIFHSVDSTYGTYHTYAALVSDDGELLAVTPEPISSPRPSDYFGARPSTLFPCGAALIGNEVLLSAGKDDEVTLILATDLDSIIERMKNITSR